MRKIYSFVLMLCLVFSLSSVVNAAELDSAEDTTYTTEAGEEIIAAFIVGSDGELIELSLDEYKAMTMTEVPLLEQILSNRPFFGPLHQTTNTIAADSNAPLTGYDFISTSSFQHYSSNIQKVSAAINCTGAGAPCPIAVTNSVEITHSFSATINSDAKISAVQASVGYNYSKVKSEIIQYTLPVAVGKKAYVGFQPLLESHYGVLQELAIINFQKVILSSTQASVTYPLKLGSFADGIYLLINADTNKPF